MDLHFPIQTIHLPQEVVDSIASHLSKAIDIATARLVNRAFCSAATSLMLNIQHSPSELFTPPTEAEIEEIEKAKPFEHLYRWPSKPFTIWTWLRVPPDVPLEDRQTKQGRKFLELITTPTTSDFLASLDDEELRKVIDGKDELPLDNGRKGTCWGRVQERAELFCIVMQWYSHMYWNAFRISKEAEDLRAFLKDVVPDCTAGSVSEDIPLPVQYKHQEPLFNSFSEIRTIYFRSTMTPEQKRDVESTKHVLRFCRFRRLGIEDAWPGESVACWLRGLRRFDGQNAVAVRMVLSIRGGISEKDDCGTYLSSQQTVTSSSSNRSFLRV